MLPVEPKDTAPSVTTMPATPGEPPAVNAPPSMGVLAQALRRCWGRALTLSLLAAALAVGAVLVALPPQYSAVVLLQVSSRAPRGEGEPDFANFQRTRSALLKSYSVLRAALEKPEVAALREVRAHADPVACLQKALVTD